MPRRDSAKGRCDLVESGYLTSAQSLKRGGNAFVPPSVASPFGHGVAVLYARSLWGGDRGLGSNVGPLALYQSTPIAIAGPGAQRMCPAQICRGRLRAGRGDP